MAKKKEVNRCPLSDSCERKCEFKNLEFKCDYFMNNMTFELEAECREKGIYLPELSQEVIDWDSVQDDDNVDEPEVISCEEPEPEDEDDELTEYDVVPFVSSDKVSFLDGERGYTAKIKDALDRARHEFIFIGLLLTEVQNFEYYKEEGWNDVYEYCESHFGFKRSSTNNFLRVYRAFGEQMTVKESYRNYSYSQLTEMCSMNNNQLKQCSPDMTVKELRDLKKSKSVQTSGLVPNQNSIETLRSLALPSWLTSKIDFLLDFNSDEVLITLLDYAVSRFANVDSGFINDKLSEYRDREYCVDGYSLLEGKLFIAHESEVVS